MCTLMHECKLCEKSLSCALDKNLHDLWLKQIRLSNIRKVLLVSSSKNGIGTSFFSVLLAKKLSDFGYKTAYLEASFSASISEYLLNTDKYDLDLSNKGIIPLKTIFNYDYMSPVFFMTNGFEIINWDNSAVLKFLEKIIINTNWERSDILIIDLPFNNINITPGLKSFFEDKLSASLLFIHDTNKTTEAFLNYFDNYLKPINVLVSPLKNLKKTNKKVTSLPFVNDFYKKNINTNELLTSLEDSYSKILKEVSESCLSF